MFQSLTSDLSEEEVTRIRNFGAQPAAVIPPPASAWMLSGGLALLGAVRRRGAA